MTVGFVGVTTPLSAAMGAMDLEYVDAIEVARAGVAELRAQNVDLLVGLVHLGELDTVMSSVALANAIEDFDVIIDGHSHTLFPEGFTQNGTLVVQAGSFANNFGQVDLEITDGAVTGVSERVLDSEDLSALAPKAETEALLDALRTSAEESFASVVGSTDVLLNGNRTRVRTGEAEVANLFTDAIRETTGADFVILGAGFVGGNVPPGPITRQQIFEIARVDTGILTKRMSGAAILQYLEGVTRDFPAESGTFPHVSGGSYRLDVEGTPRIHSVMIGGAALDPAAFYAVGIPYGGNSLAGADGAGLLEDHGSATPMLEAYIREHSPVAPALEGRFAQAPTPTLPPGGGGEQTPPSPVPDERLDDAGRGGVRVPDGATPGEQITVVVPGHGGEQVRVWLHSAPVLLAAVTLSASGSAVVTIPRDAALGDHRVVVQALDGTLIGWDAIRIGAASQAGANGARLADTGAEQGPMLFAAGALLLVLAGGAALAVAGSGRPRVSG
jgi:predicted phosphodiesterase